jgi:hypothetical protein
LPAYGDEEKNFSLPETELKSSSLEWVYIMNELFQIRYYFSHETKFIVIQLVKKCYAFCGNQGFITVLTGARNWPHRKLLKSEFYPLPKLFFLEKQT